MNTTTAGRISEYRATVAADTEMYDGENDVAYWVICDSMDTWTPSKLGRTLKIDTAKAGSILRYLVSQGALQTDDRGAWSRYWA